MRDVNRVDPRNKYVFANTQGSHQFDAVVIQVDGLDNPDLLQATKIRHTKSYYVGSVILHHSSDPLKVN